MPGKERGLSKAALARAIKISKASVTNIENSDTKSLKASTLVALESVTGISGQWIESGKGSPRTRPGPLPAGAEDQVDRIYQGLIKLPPQHRAKIEAEIDFLLTLLPKE